MLAAVSIIAVSSWIVRSHPNSGYRAGYEAAELKGPDWIKERVAASGATALSLCNELHRQSDQSATEPRYDYATFIQGCGDAVDRLYGRHVPMGSAP